MKAPSIQTETNSGISEEVSQAHSRVVKCHLRLIHPNPTPDKQEPSVKGIDNIYLTASEAAARLRIKVSTLYAWVHRGIIKYRKHGSKLVFKASDLDNWSDQHAVNPHERLTSNSVELEKTIKRRRSLKSEYTAELKPNSKIGEENGSSS